MMERKTLDLITVNDIDALTQEIASLRGAVETLVTLHEDVIVDINEAARLSGLTDNVLRNAIKSGLLNPVNKGKRGKSYNIKISELKRYQKERVQLIRSKGKINKALSGQN
ncbi:MULTISPECIES: helix-turn-helix domain-containing protein [Cysteiniphilum]|uniref:helix-turn-helix domain-containing protein n=1 Tax=Cysteiniphilum TaxID=2056696 RepID=UPI0017851EBA|nr:MULTISPECIES: helix-turn-helix domain-containing protein [Cysteiniphilum]